MLSNLCIVSTDLDDHDVDNQNKTSERKGVIRSTSYFQFSISRIAFEPDLDVNAELY